MKRYLFLWLVVFLVILVLFYFYNKREVVITKIYNEDNIYIEYPYFNNKNIDSYINNYLNNFINDSDYNYNYYLYYDYNNRDKLDIYTYKYYDNIYSYSVNTFDVCVKCNDISKIS